MSAGGRLKTLACDQTAIFGPEFVFDRATRLRVRGGQPVSTWRAAPRCAATWSSSASAPSTADWPRPELDELLGAGVFHSAAAGEAQATCGQPAYVVGAGNSAVQAAVHLARYADDVTILVRGDSLSATMSNYELGPITSRSAAYASSGHR